MRALTSSSAHFCGVYTPNATRYLRLLRRVCERWPDPVPVERVDVAALARRARERVASWRPYETL